MLRSYTFANTLRLLIALLLILLIAFFGIHCQAQETTLPAKDTIAKTTSIHYPIEYKGVFKTNPLMPLWGSIPLTAEYMGLYEFVTSPQQTSQIGLSYLTRSPVLKLFEDTVTDIKTVIINGIRGQVSHRFYLLESYFYAPKGLYLSPHISYATVKVSTKYLQSMDAYWRITHFNMNLLMGWQWIKSNALTFDVFVGMGYKENTWEEHHGQKTTTVDTDDMGNWYNRNSKISIGFYLGIGL